MKFLNNYFQLAKFNTSVSQEAIGGVTTFLTMAYILFVNPLILGDAGMDKGALFTVTCVASIVGTLLAAFWAKMPLAMAPGMGLNAFFTYTLVMNEGVSWQTALGVVFLSGVVFLLLTIAGLREKIANSIPVSIRLSVSAGIGLFITLIGLKGLGLVVDHPATLVTLGALSPTVIFGLLGLLLTGILEYKRVKGGILIGIVFTTALAVIFGEAAMPENFVAQPESMAPLVMELDVMSALKISLIGPIFSFMFVDLFDSIGTIIACAYQAKLNDKEGNVPGLKKVLMADAAATIIGSGLGTSTTTTYIESASGIAEGAKTGLASVFTAACFMLALFFSPLALAIPAYATAPALIIVGAYMFKNVSAIKFDDLTESLPAFFTVVFMPLTYSVSTGMTFGFLSYVLLKVFTGQAKSVSSTMWVIGALSLINLLV